MISTWIFALAVTVLQVTVVGSGTAPEIKSVGSVLKVPPGAKVFMACEAKGDPQPSINWEKNGIPISRLGDRFNINKASQALRIFGVHVIDEGNYTCEARNKFGVDRLTSSLIVMTLPDANIMSPTNLTFMELTNQKIVCRSRGLTRPTFEWLTNRGQRIRATDSLIGSTTKKRIHAFDRDGGDQIYESVLVFQPMTFEDFGSFACVAFNDIGHSRVSAQLDVLFSPKVLSLHSLPQQVIWWEGHNANLTCAVGANEIPVITWFRNGRHYKCNNLDEQIGEAEVTSICTIQHRSAGGPGVYRCMAANSLGQIMVHEFHVKENFPPPPVEFTPISSYLDEMTLSVKVPFKEDTPPTTYVLASYKLAYVDENRPDNPEYERMGDVNDQGEGTVKLVGLRANSDYNVTVRGRNSVGLGPGTVRVINTALPAPVTTTGKTIMFDLNDEGKDRESGMIIIIKESEREEVKIADGAENIGELIEVDIEAPTAFSVRNSNNGVVPALLVSVKHLMIVSFCLFCVFDRLLS